VTNLVYHHISRICTSFYYRLHQLRRLRRSLDSNLLVTLVYAVINSQIDYCNTVGAPRAVTNKLRRVLNATARVVIGTWKFDHDHGLGQILHDELHWLDVPDRVFFKLAVTVHRCLNGRTAVPVRLLHSGRRCRHSAAPAFCQPLTAAVPCYRLNIYGRRAFSVAGPTVWNSLPDFMRDPTINADSFSLRRLLTTYLFA